MLQLTLTGNVLLQHDLNPKYVSGFQITIYIQWNKREKVKAYNNLLSRSMFRGIINLVGSKVEYTLDNKN